MKNLGEFIFCNQDLKLRLLWWKWPLSVTQPKKFPSEKINVAATTRSNETSNYTVLQFYVGGVQQVCRGPTPLQRAWGWGQYQLHSSFEEFYSGHKLLVTVRTIWLDQEFKTRPAVLETSTLIIRLAGQWPVDKNWWRLHFALHVIINNCTLKIKIKNTVGTDNTTPKI